ncbi:receptor-type tyrosine-protein phosphatase H isoform X2 [Scophthalmus maximus]|uniref:receptor-type tyrosine-protein phosphatase H isoform X2 n=1 Tax=Scophthalmus maximus TaxID=52904 RepID=UPI0015E0D8DB|nr:receptor-type tyrosine-protein phosphatase H isoform X2 [Scophthalmus maximus]
MRKPFSSTSDRLLLCVFWTLLWGVTGSIPSTPNTAQTAIATPTDATEAETTSTLLTIPMTTIPTTKPPPGDAKDFELVGQNETSVTLQWKKVENILTYTLVFPGREINITALVEAELVRQVTSGLTSGTLYNFTLFTVSENVRSSGVNLIAVTVPRNTEEIKSVGQNETSVTLQWKKVEHILTYTLGFSGGEINVTALVEDELVTHTIPDLSSGTEYSFSLVTVFASVKSSGVNHTAVTVPLAVSSVSVTERTVTTVTLKWQDVGKGWSYLLQINGMDVTPDVSQSFVSYPVTSLEPGTEYRFSVITMFSGLNSTAYEGFTVTAIDCTSVTWHVTNSSIQGMVQGLFSNATATYKEIHVSPGGSNVSFTDLYPGATYEVSLVYERNSTRFDQCRHSLTILPPSLSARCEYRDAGYSIFLVWNKPDGVWTAVEVNVTGQTHLVPEDGKQHVEISGFHPARTYAVSLSSLSGTERSYEPFVFLCSTDPRGVIAGSVVTLLLFGVVVCLVVFILFHRPHLIRKTPFYSGSKLSSKRTISVAEFPGHFSQLSVDSNRGFGQEYESLAPVGTKQKQKAADLPENNVKNRFSNVLPYDWCRVKLTTSRSEGNSDYINASFIPGHRSRREYIATQGPLPSTVNDFWTMVWEQRVKGIVMVTNCIEGGRVSLQTKCEQYWPEDSNPGLYQELLITLRSKEQEPYWILREFIVKHRYTSEERTVKHFHFTAWPDHGVPQGTKALIQFRRIMRWHMEREGVGAPTVVHCSAGVGRTGTIIALDVLLQQLDQKRAVSVGAFVHKLRLSRPHMVQTETQYVFLHQCIMDCLQQDEKTEDNYNLDLIYVNATVLQEFR